MKKIGILLCNLGTPDAPTVAAVRRYLAEFLSDPRVVEQPRWLWWLILQGIILRIRPHRSAKLYHKIWTEQGSPLLVYSQQLAVRLQQLLPANYTVALGMRYGKPSLASALAQLQDLDKIIILPLYPQYSATTTATTWDAVSKIVSGWRNIPDIHFIHSYYQEPEYVQAMAEHIKAFWQEHGRADKLVFSFHGLPQRYVDRGDPYYQECLKTASQLADALGLGSQEWQWAFQSRLGVEKWLQPYLDESLQKLAKAGVGSVQVFCPGFAVDCLETLEEVAMQNQQRFLQAGGKNFKYISALNASDLQLFWLQNLMNKHCVH
jgi:ferrochelatase